MKGISYTEFEDIMAIIERNDLDYLDIQNISEFLKQYRVFREFE